jgi:subtilase family serine protease
VSWTIANQGTGATTSREWIDGFYLSTDAVFSPDSDTSPIGYYRQKSLGAGESYTWSGLKVDLYGLTPGKYYLFLAVDRWYGELDNVQGESEETNNVSAPVPIEILPPANTDLVVSDIYITEPPDSGGFVGISWTVTNQGTEIATGGWWDSVYLSRDEVYDDQDQYLTDAFIDSQTALASNGSYSTQQTVYLPNDLGDLSDYYLIVATDLENSQSENNNNNNTKAIPLISRERSDLIVASITAPDQANIGDTIDVSWVVQNQGTGTAIGSPDYYYYDGLNYWWDNVYLSSDHILDDSDRLLESLYISNQPPLAPGLEYGTGATVNLPDDLSGNYFLIASADDYNLERESDENNNTLARPISITNDRPDLAISATETPRTVNAGSSFQVSWTVKNQGTVAANANWYDNVYLSNDATYDSSDYYLTDQYIDSQTPLAANGTYTINRSVTLPSNVVGDRYLLFIADQNNYQGEIDETNNVLAVPITINGADLIVSAYSAPSQTSLGSTIDLSWTVKNQGKAIATADWYDYVYLSRDTLLDNSDSQVTSEYISTQTPLAVEKTYTINRSVTLSNSLPAGQLYLIFATDRDNYQLETSETNNILAVPITIAGPDLILSAATAPDSAILNSNIDVSWTVTNQGTISANADWSDYIYVSSDPLYDSSDIYVNSFYRKNSLTANLSYSQNRTITLPANSGTGDRYLLFVTDINKSQGETDDNNNVKAVPIKLSAPDLKIVSATAPSTAILNQNINVSWTVKNSGTVNAPANWYDYVYVSNDDKWDTSDLQVGAGSQYIDSQTPLAADGTYTISKNITIPTNAATGNRYLIFYADRNNYQGETDENNNTFVIPISLTAPDLIISEVTAPQTGIVGGQIQVTWKVTNQGTVDAPTDWYDDVYLSSDQWLNYSYYYYSDDIFLGRESITTQTPLAPNGSYSITKTFTLPNTGIYYNNLLENSYLIFATDRGSQQGETNENNNLKVVPITLQKPDLLVTDATAPIQADNGSTISVSWTVKNQGTVPANADWYDTVLLSQDNQLGNDTYLNQEYISTQTPLAADGSYTINRNLTLPSSSSFSGDGYLLFVTDYGYNYYNYYGQYQQAETNENNNVKAVAITLGVPDLTVASFTAPNTAILGSTVNVAWTVKNQGNVSAKADWYDKIYISDDQILGGTDTLVTEELIYSQTPLAANGSYTINKDIFLPSTATGNRYLLLVTDGSSNQGETNENNNVKAIPITLTAPDLIVSDVTAPTQASSGGMMDVSWKVTNQGNVEAPADWQDYVYLSDDQNLDYSDTLVTSESIATQTPLAAGGSYTINKNITLPNRPSGNYYLLFATDRNDKQGETNNNNNVKAVPISIGIPDLTITNATAPQRASAGETITLSWTVKNQGTTPANANWYDYVYVSSDQVVDSSDISIVSEYIDSQTPLAADGSYTATRNITLPNNAALVGDRYLIFVTDGNQNQPETSEGNNRLIIPINFSASDLTITNVTAPNTAVVGSNINVSWTVKNQGNGAANGNWYDYIYVSNDASLDNSYQISKSMTDIHARMLAKPAFVVTRIKKNGILLVIFSHLR